MANNLATEEQRLADKIDSMIFGFAGTAYSTAGKGGDKRWLEVSAALDRARNALLPLMHPEDRKIAQDA